MLIVRMQVLSYHASVPLEQLDNFKVRAALCYYLLPIFTRVSVLIIVDIHRRLI